MPRDSYLKGTRFYYVHKKPDKTMGESFLFKSTPYYVSTLSSQKKCIKTQNESHQFHLSQQTWKPLINQRPFHPLNTNPEFTRLSTPNAQVRMNKPRYQHPKLHPFSDDENGFKSMVYTANWGIICHLPPFRGTRNNH